MLDNIYSKYKYLNDSFDENINCLNDDILTIQKNVPNDLFYNNNEILNYIENEFTKMVFTLDLSYLELQLNIIEVLKFIEFTYNIVLHYGVRDYIEIDYNENNFIIIEEKKYEIFTSLEEIEEEMLNNLNIINKNRIESSRNLLLEHYNIILEYLYILHEKNIKIQTLFNQINSIKAFIISKNYKEIFEIEDLTNLNIENNKKKQNDNFTISEFGTFLFLMQQEKLILDVNKTTAMNFARLINCSSNTLRNEINSQISEKGKEKLKTTLKNMLNSIG